MEGQWKWVNNLRRHVFYKGVDFWEDFLRAIEGVILVEGTPNKVIWAPSSIGKFSCRSSRRLLALGSQVSNRWKGLWEMPVPLKAKCLSS